MLLTIDNYQFKKMYRSLSIRKNFRFYITNTNRITILFQLYEDTTYTNHIMTPYKSRYDTTLVPLHYYASHITNL